MTRPYSDPIGSPKSASTCNDSGARHLGASGGGELRIAVSLPSRTGTGDGVTRYIKVVSFGVLAIHTAASVRKGDRVTVQGYDVTSEAWAGNDGQPRSKTSIRATDVAVSMRYDALTTGRATRAARHAAPAEVGRQVGQVGRRVVN